MSARPGVAQASHLPLVQHDLAWQKRAACRDKSPRLFSDPSLVHSALRICAGCPVRKPCEDLTPPQTEGVWGGLAHYSRKSMPAARASARDTLALLARTRRSRGLSQEDVAEILGVTDAFISMLESGKRLPRLDLLLQWADVVGVEITARKQGK